MLWMDYYSYLMKLPELERTKQIFILIIFFVIVILIGIIYMFIKKRQKGK